MKTLRTPALSTLFKRLHVYVYFVNVPIHAYSIFCFDVLNILPCPGTTQSAISSTILLLSSCLEEGMDFNAHFKISEQVYFCSSSEPADFHNSGSSRSSSFSKLSPAMTTVPCSLVPVTTTTLTLSRVWPGVAITLTAPSGSSFRPSGSSSLLVPFLQILFF